MTTKLDQLDLQIIKKLWMDARASFKQLARELGVSEATIHNRVNRLVEQGIIKRFVPELDHSKLGYDLTVLIGIVAEGRYLRELEDHISQHPNVCAVYDVTGEYDAVLIAKFDCRENLDRFVKKLISLDHVKKTYTMLVLNICKERPGVELEKLM